MGAPRQSEAAPGEAGNKILSGDGKFSLPAYAKATARQPAYAGASADAVAMA